MLFNNFGSCRRETNLLTGQVTLGASGAVTNQTKRKLSGYVIARTGVGIYTITLDRTAARYTVLLGLDIKIISATAAYPAASGSSVVIFSDLTATTGVITVKFYNGAMSAVAEIENSAKLIVNLLLSSAVEEVV